LDIDPDQADVLASLGNLSFDAGDYERALTYYQEAELLDRELSGLNLFYALVYAKTGDRALSDEYLAKAILLDENAKKVFDEIINDDDEEEKLIQT